MESIFVNQYIITYEILLDQVLHPQDLMGKRNRKRSKIFQIMALFCDIFVLILSVFSKDLVLFSLSVMLLAVIIHRIFFKTRSAVRIQYEQAKAIIGTDELRYEIHFGDEIEVTDKNDTGIYEYHQITDISSDNRFCYLWIGENMVIRVMSDGFTTGSYEKFERFIWSKCKASTGGMIQNF